MEIPGKSAAQLRRRLDRAVGHQQPLEGLFVGGRFQGEARELDLLRDGPRPQFWLPDGLGSTCLTVKVVRSALRIPLALGEMAGVRETVMAAAT